MRKSQPARAIDPTGRVDILVTRLFRCVCLDFERDTGARGLTDLLSPHVAEFARRKFGPRRRRLHK